MKSFLPLAFLLLSSPVFAEGRIEDIRPLKYDPDDEYYKSKLFTLGSISNDIQYEDRASEYFRIHCGEINSTKYIQFEGINSGKSFYMYDPSDEIYSILLNKERMINEKKYSNNHDIYPVS